MSQEIQDSTQMTRSPFFHDIVGFGKQAAIKFYPLLYWRYAASPFCSDCSLSVLCAWSGLKSVLQASVTHEMFTQLLNTLHKLMPCIIILCQTIVEHIWPQLTLPRGNTESPTTRLVLKCWLSRWGLTNQTKSWRLRHQNTVSAVSRHPVSNHQMMLASPVATQCNPFWFLFPPVIDPCQH